VFLSPSSMTPLMWGEMILFMALLMFGVHVLRTNHLRRRGQSSHVPSGVVSAVHWGIKVLLHLGIRVTILGPMMLLTVRGRKTGKPRTIPVDLHERGDRRFLMATHGEGNWVRNLRVAGEGVLSLGRHQQAFTAVELAPEVAGPVIKEILGPLLASSGMRGNALRQHLGVRADSSLHEFITVARTHSVFELDAPKGSFPVKEEQPKTADHSIPGRREYGS
jgi:deazaflavin-dependent oxidoreductase (nitroreductase family)